MGPDGDIAGHWYRSENRALDVMAVSHIFVSLSEIRRATIPQDQGTSWSGGAPPLSLGAGCGATQRSSHMQLAVPVKALSLDVVSALACAPAIPDDTEVMSLVITDTHGKTYSYGFRAGRDTSEWAFDCTDVFPQMRHRRAAVASSFPAERRRAEVCNGHRYVGTLPFAHEIDVIAVTLTWTGPPAAIVIETVTLHNAMREPAPPPPTLEEFLSGSARWGVAEESNGVRVYANGHAMPRAWLVPETVTLKPDQVLAALKSSRLPDGRPFDPSRIALIEDPLELNGGADTAAEAVVQRVTDTVVKVGTRSSAVSFLVLSDVFYPGWSVTIDGSPARLYQANYVLRGVVVPAGEHVITFRFRPGTFYAGLAITVLCSVITMGLPVFGILRKRAKTRAVRETAHAVEP
jgi:hypothetical protein